MLAGLLAVALAAITFNTIRLQILAQGAEIEVAQLIGATSGYIRRPFYYFGAIQGALGGLLALGLVALGVHTLSPSVAELAGLYGANFRLQGLDPVGSVLLVLAGAFLGWLGAQLSVGLYLRRMPHLLRSVRSPYPRRRAGPGPWGNRYVSRTWLPLGRPCHRFSA